MDNKKIKKTLTITWIIIVLIIIWLILYIINSKKSVTIIKEPTIVNTNSWVITQEKDKDLEYINILPQLKWRDLSLKYCFFDEL